MAGGASSTTDSVPATAQQPEAGSTGRLVEEEERAIGHVGTQMYLHYFHSWGPLLLLPALMLALQLGNQGLVVGHPT